MSLDPGAWHGSFLTTFWGVRGGWVGAAGRNPPMIHNQHKTPHSIKNPCKNPPTGVKESKPNFLNQAPSKKLLKLRKPDWFALEK